MSSANGRLVKELQEVGRDDKSGVMAVPVAPGNLKHLKGTIKGPEGTPYEGGVFAVNIEIPKQYPFEPLKMKFDTKIWHPNVSSQTGAICLVSMIDTFVQLLHPKNLLNDSTVHIIVKGHSQGPMESRIND
jgi:ubiquitin-conjugating enzyme (huntingtin interacting protein 2)